MPTLIHTYMRNRETRFLRPYPWEQLREYLSYHPSGYEWMPRYRTCKFCGRTIYDKNQFCPGQNKLVACERQWDGKIRLLKYDRVPTGLFLALREEMEQKLDVRFQVESDLRPIAFRDGTHSDRDYQEECVQKMQGAAGRGGGLILSATGTGKTRMIGLLFQRLQGRACFIVDELTLLKQAKQEMESVTGEVIGEIGHSEFQPQRLTVATVQTLHKHRNRAEFRHWSAGLQVMVIDELHLALNRRQFKTVETMKPLSVFGLTATLELQKRGIRLRSYAICGPVIFQYSLSQGTEEGYLCSGIVTQIPVPYFYHHRDWTDEYRQIVIRGSDRNDLIESLAREAVCQGRTVVILVEWISHLNEISRRLSDIPHRKIYGQITVEERIEAKALLEDAGVSLLICNRVFKKGIDIKKIDCLIDGAGLKSKTDCVQKFGRGVRLSAGKRSLIYFDIADSGNRFSDASASRKRAFQRARIPVYSVPYRKDLNVEKLVRKVIELSEQQDANRRGTGSGTIVEKLATDVVAEKLENLETAPSLSPSLD